MPTENAVGPIIAGPYDLIFVPDHVDGLVLMTGLGTAIPELPQHMDRLLIMAEEMWTELNLEGHDDLVPLSGGQRQLRRDYIAAMQAYATALAVTSTRTTSRIKVRLPEDATANFEQQ